MRRGDVVEEVAHRAGADRVGKITSDLRGRFEHEPPRRHPGVWHREVRGIHDDVFVEEQIEVDRPLAPALRPLAVQRVLDGRQHVEHLSWREFRFDEAGAVQE